MLNLSCTDDSKRVANPELIKLVSNRSRCIIKTGMEEELGKEKYAMLAVKDCNLTF